LKKLQRFYLKYIHSSKKKFPFLYLIQLKATDITKEELGDLVEKQLQLTHETIDEAVRQLEV
jgi:hypothetical protein